MNDLTKRRTRSIATNHSSSPMMLSSSQINAFFADLFISLNKHLSQALTPEQKRMVLHEARQYLYGAQALWTTAKVPVAVSDGEGQVAAYLMESLLMDTNAYIAEVESELGEPPSRGRPPGSFESFAV